MSAAFMYAIAAMYAGASICFYLEGRFLWFLLAFSWGMGSAVVAFMSHAKGIA